MQPPRTVLLSRVSTAVVSAAPTRGCQREQCFGKGGADGAACTSRRGPVKAIPPRQEAPVEKKCFTEPVWEEFVACVGEGLGSLSTMSTYKKYLALLAKEKRGSRMGLC